MPRFNLDEYITVQQRINQFWQDYPDGAIITELASPKENFSQCRYKASVYTNREEVEPRATGYAFEIAQTSGQGPNVTSHEENCETSAIGRALANLGYATSQKDRPSRQEMEKVERRTDELIAQDIATIRRQTTAADLERVWRDALKRWDSDASICRQMTAAKDAQKAAILPAEV